MSIDSGKGPKIKATAPRVADAGVEQSTRKRRDELQQRRGVLANILSLGNSPLKSLLG